MKVSCHGFLQDSNGEITNLGTVKTADLEKVAACDPDVIFIGGRLSSVYEDLSAIAPVVYLAVDYEKGVVQSTADNAKTIASIFGKEAEIDSKMEGFQTRIDALKAVLEGKNVLLGMYNSNALGLMDTESQLNIIAKELGANNLGETVGEVNCYKDGKIVYFIEHANVWYTSTGGIQALDTMLADLEAALIQE